MSTPDLLAGVRNGAWLDAQDFPPLSYAVDGLLPEGTSLLVGAPKAGKSWLTLDVACAVAAGGYAVGSIKVEQRPVLLLALEDGDRRLQDRCRHLLGRDRIPGDLQYATRVGPNLIEATIAAWLEQYGRDNPLVVLDTLGKCMPPAMPGESAYARDYRIGGRVKALADAHPGTSVLVVHHVRKQGGDDWVDQVSGTHGLAGSADTIVVLSRARHETAGLLKVTGRDVHEGEYALTFGSSGQWQLDGADLDDASRNAAAMRATEGVGEDMAKVIAIVTGAGKPVGPTYVATQMNCDVRKAGTYLGRAVKSGRLAQCGRGQYTPVESVDVLKADTLDSTDSTVSTALGEQA